MTSRASSSEPLRSEKTSSASDDQPSPAASRAYDAQPPLPSTARTGSIRPVVSSQRSRCASSAWRHSRAMPASPMKSGQNTRAAAEHRLEQQDRAEAERGQRDGRADVGEPADPAGSPAAAGRALQAGGVGSKWRVGGQHQPQAGVQRDADAAERRGQHERRRAPRAPGSPRWRARPAGDAADDRLLACRGWRGATLAGVGRRGGGVS